MPLIHTGEEVASDSEAWRAECEARYVLALSPGDRMDYLRGRDVPGGSPIKGVLQVRGQRAAQALADTMRKIRDARRSNQGAG